MMEILQEISMDSLISAIGAFIERKPEEEHRLHEYLMLLAKANEEMERSQILEDKKDERIEGLVVNRTVLLNKSIEFQKVLHSDPVLSQVTHSVIEKCILIGELQESENELRRLGAVHRALVEDEKDSANLINEALNLELKELQSLNKEQNNETEIFAELKLASGKNSVHQMRSLEETIMVKLKAIEGIERVAGQHVASLTNKNKTTSPDVITIENHSPRAPVPLSEPLSVNNNILRLRPINNHRRNASARGSPSPTPTVDQPSSALTLPGHRSIYGPVSYLPLPFPPQIPDRQREDPNESGRSELRPAGNVTTSYLRDSRAFPDSLSDINIDDNLL